LNMVYMICYFVAGAIGSYVGTVLWERFGWAGVCAFGGSLPVIGCVIHVLAGQGNRQLYEAPAEL